jgi:NitT/TauT family transport system ATP-binding protein
MPIVCKNISFSYSGLQIFRDFSLSLEDQSVTAVLGPSGCGKTTLLHLISDLLEPDAGLIEGKSGERISYLFQEPRMLPWRSVRRNIELVLESQFSAQERRERATEFLQLVGLKGFEDYYPHQLSGGMRQRAAIARAFAYQSEVMLMDEPFQALDLRRKLMLIEQFEQLWRRDPRTALFVTHDIQEALLLGDTIVLLGDPPGGIQTILHNRVKRSQRSLREPVILELEKQLYEGLVGSCTQLSASSIQTSEGEGDT